MMLSINIILALCLLYICSGDINPFIPFVSVILMFVSLLLFSSVCCFKCLYKGEHIMCIVF